MSLDKSLITLINLLFLRWSPKSTCLNSSAAQLIVVSSLLRFYLPNFNLLLVVGNEQDNKRCLQSIQQALALVNNKYGEYAMFDF
jgi:hypothetical protein